MNLELVRFGHEVEARNSAKASFYIVISLDGREYRAAVEEGLIQALVSKAYEETQEIEESVTEKLGGAEDSPEEEWESEEEDSPYEVNYGTPQLEEEVPSI